MMEDMVIVTVEHR